MTSPKAVALRRCCAVLAAAGALAGWSATAATTDRPAPEADSRVASQPASPPAEPAPAVAKPSAAALMVCDKEIRDDVRTLFRLAQPPKPTATWRNSVYHCRYALPHGRLTISVSEDGTHQAALARFTAARRRASGNRAIEGLASFGLPAFETAGLVMFAKDDKTLVVDARGLPARATPDGQAREDIAYQFASDILSCWHE